MSSRETWAIRVLSGPQAGQIMPLTVGYNVIGRSPNCQIKLASNAVSKEHATVLVTDDGKVIITDMNSRNGTFVNGLRVQNQKLQAGDKLTFHDLIIDILKLPAGVDPRHVQNMQNGLAPMPAWAGNGALAMPVQQHPMAAQAYPDPSAQVAQDVHAEVEHDARPRVASSGNALFDLLENLRLYLDHVAMPGIYSLIQRMNYRQGLLLLIAIYAVVLTFVATIPMVTLTKSSIRQESVRRAKTIARNLAAINRQAILEKNEVAVTVRLAELEEGVSTAVIINKDGTILAPANKRGEFAKMPFVNQARREERETDGFTGDSTLGVAVPISRYNPDTGSQEAAAYSVVLYDMGSMAMSPAQTMGLFLQIFLVAALLGGVLFFFLSRVVEHPVELLSTQLNDALREGRDDLATPYQYPLLEKLISNVNSALNRAANGSGQAFGGVSGGVINRDIEASNVVRMLNTPALSINAIDDRVIATNSAFDHLIGSAGALVGRSINEVPDPALQANLRDLLPRMREQMGSIAFSEIPFSGEKYEINGQAVLNHSGEAGWYLVVLQRSGG